MITYKTGTKFQDVYYFEALKEFDGRIISGDRFCTVLPISSYEHRQSEDYRRIRNGRDGCRVQAQINGSVFEFFITDDWGELHLLQIPAEMTEVISAAKAAILKNQIPCNFLPEKEVIRREKL